MRFKDLFDREILTESHVRKELKIFYRLDLDLYKNKVETEQPVNNIQSVQEPTNNTPAQPVEQPVNNNSAPEATPVDNTTQDVTQPVNNNSAPEITSAVPETVKFSVVTEDEISGNTENRIMRKFADFDKGIALSNKEEDITNSFQDILDKLSKTEKDGTPILDDFCIEIINLLANQKFNDIKNQLDKKSKIFVEILYGFNKDDSVGIRFNKPANSENVTALMLIDNKIIPMPFNISKFNERMISLRNERVSNS